MRPMSRSRLPKFLWYFCLCASVWFVARASDSSEDSPAAAVAGSPVSCPTEAAVASDEPACGRLCGQVARRAAACESQTVVTCCDAEHPLACDTADCSETASSTPEEVLQLMERLAPEAFSVPHLQGEPALGQTMVGQIGESTAEACDREAMLACLRQLDTDHHVRAAAAACEVACDEGEGCCVTRICTDPIIPGASVCAAPCTVDASACATSNCKAAACKPSHCVAATCGTPVCGTTVCSAPAYPAPAVTAYGYCAPAVAPPAYYPASPAVCAPNPYMPSCSKWHSLHSSSMQLESVAQGLETAELYEESDRVRQLAQELRMAARVARRPEPTMSVPLDVSTGGEHVAPPAEASLPAPPCGDSASTVQPVSAAAAGNSGCLSIRVGFCDRPCPGTGASPGSEACTGHAGGQCSHPRTEGSSAPCSAPCTGSCPSEFGILVDTDADGNAIVRRVED